MVNEDNRSRQGEAGRGATKGAIGWASVRLLEEPCPGHLTAPIPSALHLLRAAIVSWIETRGGARAGETAG